MERLTYRDAEGHARWRAELLEDDTGAAGELIRNKMAELEDIVEGCELRRLRELVEADLDGRCVVLQKEAELKKGDKAWYVDKENGEIESGTVFSVEYKDGKLFSFSVDFDCGDFDEFDGSAWGDCFFASMEVAENEIRGG